MRPSYQREPSPERLQFRQVADEMLIPVVEFDLDFIMQYANPAAIEMLQLNVHRFNAGIHADDLVLAEQQALIHEGLNLLRAGSVPTSISLRLIKGTGVAIPSQVYADAITNGSDVAGFVVYAVDLTRREAAEAKILSRKEVLEFMVDYYSFSGIIIVDNKYTFEYVNDKMCDILGRMRSEVLGHDFREFLHHDSVDLVADRYRRRQMGEEVPSEYELKIVRKDGEIRDIRMNVGAIQGKDGKTRTVAQLLDITDENRRAHALEESEHRYRSLIETMDSGLSVDNGDGRMVLVNNALCRMLGYDSPPELIGHRITEILHGWTENHVHEKVEARKAGKIEHYEAQLIHKTGGVVPVVVTATPVLDKNGQYMGSMGVFTDISELKKTEAEVHFLLDLLLHDIGNQLQLIIAGGDFLEKDIPSEQILRSKRYIMDGALRCLELIQKVRRAEESKSEPLSPTHLCTVAEAEAELLFKQRGVRADLCGLEQDVVVYADQALSQLIWNLLENAVIHNNKEDKDKNIEVSGRSEDDQFILTIADNGPGIPNGKKNELFDPTRRYGGVGLHLVRRLAEKYSGSSPIVRDRVTDHPEEGLAIDIRFRVVK
ncbi:MAG: PAS domain S-box protein [Candidatus Thorarchaeota archaeon]|nr:PAS domain S-box protein [Candidatus Thorarchaeota archaeon]